MSLALDRTLLRGTTHVLHSPNVSLCADHTPNPNPNPNPNLKTLTLAPTLTLALTLTLTRCALFNADAPAERQMLTQRPPWCAVGQP